MKQLDRLNEATKALQDATHWNRLPFGKKYDNSKFDISAGHCKITLTRAGQQCQGGKNYWETDSAFNSALLQAIVETPSLISKALSIMEERVNQSTVDCKKFHEELGKRIEQAEKD